MSHLTDEELEALYKATKLSDPAELFNDTPVSATRLLIEEVRRWRRLYLDKPEDRLWHDSDKTWWTRRDDTHLGVGGLFRASPPEPVRALAKVTKQALKLLRKLEADRVIQAEPLLRRLEDLLPEPSPSDVSLDND